MPWLSAVWCRPQVRELSRVDFVREVTEASRTSWVIVLLYKAGIEASKQLEEVMPAVGGVAIALSGPPPAYSPHRTC